MPRSTMPLVGAATMAIASIGCIPDLDDPTTTATGQACASAPVASVDAACLDGATTEGNCVAAGNRCFIGDCPCATCDGPCTAPSACPPGLPAGAVCPPVTVVGRADAACMCGCNDCLLACDDAGYVVTATTPGTRLLELQLSGLPASASGLELLVRARGRPRVVFQLQFPPSGGSPTGPIFGDETYQAFSDLTVHFNNDSWDMNAMPPQPPPTTIRMDSSLAAPAITEIDCLVPYYLP